MGAFRSLVDDGSLDLHNELHIACCRRAFMPYIQHELDCIRTMWNTHTVRPTAQSSMPGGIPDKLHFLPRLYDTRDYGKPVSPEQAAICQQWINPQTTTTGSSVADEYFEVVYDQLDLQDAFRWPDCVRVFLTLKEVSENGR